MAGQGSQVRLLAYASDGQLVEEVALTHEEFYDGRPPLIDSAEYRRERSMARVVGEVYSPKGLLDQQFTNNYAADGRYTSGRTEHADGTVIQD